MSAVNKKRKSEYHFSFSKNSKYITETSDNEKDKQIIESLKNKIFETINNDPKKAKDAAALLTELINQASNKK